MLTTKKIARAAAVVNMERRKYGWPAVAIRVPEYFLTTLFFMVKLGDFEKTKYFHANVNYFHKLRYSYIAKIDREKLNSFNARFLKGDRYVFNDIVLPKVRDAAMYYIYNDVLKVYVEYNDNYDYRLVDRLDLTLPEGVYCYKNEDLGADMTIHEGDVVIDAGAWIGDFSIYAAQKGAKVFAFEPAPSSIDLLKKTIEYNKAGEQIQIVEYGLGGGVGRYLIKDDVLSGGNSKSDDGNVMINITTVDDFVRNNNLTKLDFIKADIEGEERNLLLGAKETLKNLQPRVSICTYHREDDPQVLERIILEANPNYKIIHRKAKLFAFVV